MHKACKQIVAIAIGVVLVVFGISVFANDDLIEVSFERLPAVSFSAMEEEIDDPYSYDKDIALYPSYQPMADNDQFSLYLDDDTHNIAVLVKENGYIWFSTDPDYDGIDSVTGREHNLQTQNRIRSSIMFRTTQFETISSDFYLLNVTNEVTYATIENGFAMFIDLPSSGLSFEVRVAIDTKGLTVDIPFSSIIEENLRLQSIRVFPGFGMTTGDNMTGYLFIPDGSGALIRYTTRATGLAYNEYIYGIDQGYATLSQELVLNQGVLPAHQNKAAILGVVHGVSKNAFVATIEEGAYYAQIRAEAKSNVTKYFSSTFAFNYRLLYFRPTNAQGDGFRITAETMIENDVSIRYTFLSNEEANYVGMAKAYRSRLFDQGMVLMNPTVTVPLHIDLVGMDVVKGLFRNKEVVMTTYDEALSIIKDIDREITRSLHVSYRAKSAEGAYVFGHNRKIGSSSDYRALAGYAEDRGIPLMLFNEYNFIPDTNRNIAKQIGGNIMGILSTSSVFPRNYLLDITAIKDNHDEAIKVIQKDNIGLYADKTGTHVYSHLGASKNLVSRDEMAKTIITQFDDLEDHQLMLKNPIEIMYPLVDSITGQPLSSSGYAYITDTVPFMAIALSGLMNVFSEPMNFIANRDVYVLKMIEYGIFPSYVLTSKDAFLLKGSDDVETFSSEYRLWKNVIKNEYTMIDAALHQVLGATIANHQYLGDDVYVTTYSNGINIAVNYKATAAVIDAGSVPAFGYLVWEV